MKNSCDALSPPETVSSGLLILARIIAREAISARLAACGAASQECLAETEQPAEKAAVL